MNPGRYQLPQYVSDDRRRARAHTLALDRKRFEWERRTADDRLIVSDEVPLLPPTVKELPSEYDFPISMTAGLVGDTVRTSIIESASRASTAIFPLKNERGYRRLFSVMGGTSSTFARWKEDTEFGRLRMTGVNPMHIRRCLSVPGDDLRRACEVVLASQQASRAKLALDEVIAKGRLLMTDYPALWDPRVQECLQPRAVLAAPTCIFWREDSGALLPLAIQLKPPSEANNPVFTPLHDFADWMMARAHAQAADTHMHESPYHLLETHLVNGVVSMAIYRELHPDHPLRQLLEPHYEYTLAINKLADNNLLKPNGSIDNGLSARVKGALRAAQLHYQTWDWEKRTLREDLKSRGLDGEEEMPAYYYRDDAVPVHEAIDGYVAAILRLWYRHDGDVEDDTELAAFVGAIADPQQGAIKGFPARVQTRRQLCKLAAELIFRAGPQHAAVNNGQFDAYGWIPGTPGMLTSALPERAWSAADDPSTKVPVFSERELWEAMPDAKPSLAQMGMVWILSRPTRRSLLNAGDSPAFHPRRCFEADDIIGAFRRRLRMISDSIQLRNDRIQQPYRYLDPLNISRSTDI